MLRNRYKPNAGGSYVNGECTNRSWSVSHLGPVALTLLPYALRVQVVAYTAGPGVPKAIAHTTVIYRVDLIVKRFTYVQTHVFSYFDNILHYEAATFTTPTKTSKAAGRASPIAILSNVNLFHPKKTQLAAHEELTHETVCWRCRCFESVCSGKLFSSHKTTGRLLVT